jgi:hypothetical protein
MTALGRGYGLRSAATYVRPLPERPLSEGGAGAARNAMEGRPQTRKSCDWRRLSRVVNVSALLRLRREGDVKHVSRLIVRRRCVRSSTTPTEPTTTAGRNRDGERRWPVASRAPNPMNEANPRRQLTTGLRVVSGIQHNLNVSCVADGLIHRAGQFDSRCARKVWLCPTLLFGADRCSCTDSVDGDEPHQSFDSSSCVTFSPWHGEPECASCRSDLCGPWGNRVMIAPPGTGPCRSAQRMSASRYSSSCRRIAARSSGVHENLTHRPRFHCSRHLRWSARETNFNSRAVRVTLAPETRPRLSLLAQRLA